MIRLIYILLTMGSLGLLVGCDEDINSGESSGAGSGGTENPDFICSDDNPCGDNQFCFNGLCALGCNSDADCSDDSFCEGELRPSICVANTVFTCDADDDCLGGMACINTFCSVPLPDEGSCNPNGADDGCPSNALCVDVADAGEEADYECVEFPPCSKDGTCPIGPAGALCNNDIIPEKDKICLTGMCEDEGNCPADFGCIDFPGTDVGACSDGSIGMLCEDDEDCQEGGCMAFAGLGQCLGGFGDIPDFDF